MHPGAVAALRCPVDAAAFTHAGTTLRCETGHSFDVARQGYVNLVTGRHHGTGDDAAMVAARRDVFDRGGFAPITDAIVAAVGAQAPDRGVVVDVGAGTGDHLAAVLDAAPHRSGIAIDLSKSAARRAARRHDRLVSVVADAWHGLPVATGAAAAVLGVFAPRNVPEIVRILRADGVLVLVTPTPDHLVELVRGLGLVTVDPCKADRLRVALDPALVDVVPARAVRAQWDADRDEVGALVGMGPSADHLEADELRRRVRGLPAHVPVTASVEVRVLQPR